MALTKITSDVIETGAITSDKLASGAVSASSLSSITTDNVSEGSTNTYFTNARARGSVSVTGGGLSYDSGTGVIQIGSIPNSSLTNSSLTVNSNSVSLGGSVTLDTDDIGEGSSNLYFTNARAQGAISGGTGVTISSGTISIGQDVATSSTPTFGNITTTGYIAGPATFTIDPAAVGDNTGTVVIAGNLQVDGTTTTINSTTMTVDDLNITLASGAANAAAANGAGITVDGASATITYDGTNDEWDFNKPINIDGGATAYNFAASENMTIVNSSGYASMEMGGSSGAYIDLKNPNSDDYDLRLITFGSGGQIISASGSDLLLASSGNSNQLYLDSSGNVGIGTDSPVSNSNRTTLGLQGTWGGQLDIMVGSAVHAQFGTDNFSSGSSCRVQSADNIVFKTGGSGNISQKLNSDGYASFYRAGSEYGMELKSAGSRSGLVIKKPGTDSIMGSVLVLTDESYRLGTAANYHLEMLQNGYQRTKTPQGTYFTITKNFTCTGNSVTNHAINVTTEIGASALGTLRYEVMAAGYGSGGTNGVNAKYSVAGYSGHSYSGTNYGSFGAGTIQNGYKSSNATSYDAIGISYHPCINMGSYIANGEIYAYVPGTQQYGFTVSNNSSSSFGITIIITGFYT
jgi:hypothetical protein